MSKRMDWIPCDLWGQDQIIPVGTQADLPLMDIAQIYDPIEVVGRVESSPFRYFVHRIVGQIGFWWADVPTGFGLVHLRVWPAFVETDAAPQVVTPDFIDEDEGANARLWWERKVRTVSSQRYQNLDPAADPWWSTVDIKPRQVIEKYQVPTLSVLNTDGTIQLSFTHWLRMLVSPLDG